MSARRRRPTLAEIRAAAKAERDLEVAAFLEGYADLKDSGRAPGAPPCEVATMARGLASSLRAGIVE
jgi:hypothetical protein